jgi:hypothetical protein
MRQFIFTFFVVSICDSFSFGQGKESLKIVWPEEYKWKIGSNQENQSIHLMELVPGDETIHQWTIMGTMMSLKGAKGIAVEKVMSAVYAQAKQNAPDAVLTFIEKKEEGKHPWIIFKIESSEFKNDKSPESQLYYIIQGESSLYTNLVSLKMKRLDDEFVNKWKGIFKASELVYQ